MEMLKKDSFQDPDSHNVKVNILRKVSLWGLILSIFSNEINNGGDCLQ